MRRHYQTLGVPMHASKDEIRKAFRTLAKKFHPDHNPNDPHAEENFKKIAAAYAVLMGRSDQPVPVRGDLSVWLLWAFWPVVLFPWALFGGRADIGTSSASS